MRCTRSRLWMVVAIQWAVVGCHGASSTAPPAPTELVQVVAGGAQTAITVGTYADSLIARVVDGKGRPMAGITVDWSQSGSASTVQVPSTVSDANGRVADRILMDTVAAQTTVVASIRNGTSKATFSITSVAGPPVAVAFGTARQVVVDSGKTAPLPVSVVDRYKNPLNSASVSVVSRSVAADVPASGTVRGLLPGQAIIVAHATADASLQDSVLVAVASPGSPVLRFDAESFSVGAGSTTVVSLFSDINDATVRVGSATVTLSFDPSEFAYVDWGTGDGTVAPEVNASLASSGTITLAFASARGIPAHCEVLRVRLQAVNFSGRSGALSVAASEVTAAVSFADLLAHTVSVTQPVRTK